MVDTSSRPQLMFTVRRVNPNTPYGFEDSLFTVYQEENPLMLSSGHPKMLLSPTCVISQPIRGLFCLEENKRVKIYNPVTNKYSVPSPEIPAPEDTAISTFFGYDEQTDVYKVLGIIEVVEFEGGKRKTVEQTFYVWTMGSDENAWKQITCDQPLHSPCRAGPGLSKGGVLYYRATNNTEEYLLMSFNVGSGKFSAIEVPENFNISRGGMQLVIYEDNIALVDDLQFMLGPVNNYLYGYLAFNIWVMNDEHGWLNKRIEIPGWKETVLENTTHSIFLFRGTTKTGILVFSTGNSFRKIGDEESLFVVCYDERTKELRRFTLLEQGDEAASVRTYLDYIDSPLLL